MSKPTVTLLSPAELDEIYRREIGGRRVLNQDDANISRLVAIARWAVKARHRLGEMVHRRTCAWWGNLATHCDCGFDALLDEVTPPRR